MTGDDRRTSPRYQFPGTVEIVSRSHSERLLAEVSDISLGGCYILTEDPLDADAVVHLKFSLGAAEFEMAGVVRNRRHTAWECNSVTNSQHQSQRRRLRGWRPGPFLAPPSNYFGSHEGAVFSLESKLERRCLKACKDPGSW
jgi:hypothetical protein